LNLETPFLRLDLDDTQLEKLFTVIPVATVLLAAIASLWIYFSVASLLPEAETLVNLPELNSKVTVFRERDGVPTIVADSEADLAAVLGYVMAQDRLWQIDYLRRLGQGRLSEILGREYLVNDQIMRAISSAGGKRNELSDLTQAETVWLEKFIQGINSFLILHKDKTPVEFSLLDYRPSLFSKEDVRAIMLGLAWQSSTAARLDPLFNRLVSKVDPAALRMILPSDPAAPQTPIPPDLIGWEPRGLLFDQFSGERQKTSPLGLRGGIAFTLAPQVSRTGSTLLGGAIYQDLSAPGFWYRARLTAPNFHLVGAFVPGLPVALSGANERMSWLSVPCPVDDMDLYIEHIDPENPVSFLRADGRRKTAQTRQRFDVKGGSKIDKVLVSTDVGPVVSDVENGRAFSMRWTGQDGTGLFKSLFKVNRASSANTLSEALATLTAPAVQVAWADTDGNIGIQFAGKIPIRHHDSDGIIALPAWTGIHNWQGYVPYVEMPHVINPEKGYLVAADGRPGGPDYPYLFGCYWMDGPREARLSELLRTSPEQDLRSLIGLLQDVHSHLASKLVPTLIRQLEEGENHNEQEKAAVELLREWDFLMTRESAGAAIFSLFYQNLVETILVNSLGRDVYGQLHRDPDLLAFLIMKKFGGPGQKTSGSSAVREFMIPCFRAAVARGSVLMGDKPSTWKWGKLHTVDFHHPVAVRSSFLEALFDVGPVPEGGSWDSVRMMAWSPASGFQTRTGASLKLVAEMTPSPAVAASVPLGNSGHFFSSHYKNELSNWAGGRLIAEKVKVGENVHGTAKSIVFRPTSPQSPLSN